MQRKYQQQSEECNCLIRSEQLLNGDCKRCTGLTNDKAKKILA